MKIFASRGNGNTITLGDLYEIMAIHSTKIKIYDSELNEIIWDERFDNALKEYPELIDTPIIEMQASGSHRLSIRVHANFQFTPAW